MSEQTSVREALPEDAPALAELQRILAEETTFLLLEPGEIPGDPGKLAAHLEAMAGRENATWFVACDGPTVVGFLGADGGLFARNRATVKVFLGVAKSHWGQGVGRALLQAVEDWARTRAIRRLELTVMVHNERARTLYERMGYEIEGLLRQTLVVDGAPVDEYVMSKLL